jgi:hypothetical protein
VAKCLTPVVGDELRRAVLDLLADEPDDRWSVARITRHLAEQGIRPDGDHPCQAVADAVWAEIATGAIRQAGLAAYRLASSRVQPAGR